MLARLARNCVQRRQPPVTCRVNSKDSINRSLIRRFTAVGLKPITQPNYALPNARVFVHNKPIMFHQHMYQWFHTSVRPLIKVKTIEGPLPESAPVVPPDSFEMPVYDLAKTEMYKRNKMRKGLARGKTRGEVSGSTRKVYRQKGTGRARVSTIRSPIRRGGGKAHPPRGPRDFSIKVNKKVRRLALKSALAAKFAHRQLFIIESLTPSSNKTKHFVEIVKRFGWDMPLLVTPGEPPETLQLATRNLQKVNLLNSLNVLSILKHKELVMSREALQMVIKKFSEWEGVPITQ